MPDTLAGKKLKCKKCEGPIQVPAVEAAPEEPTKVSPNAVVKAATILRAEPDMGGSGSDPAEAPKRNRKPEKETESSATEAKAARQKAKRDAKAKQSRRAVKGCLLIALGLLVVGAGVALYFLYYPLIDRGVPTAKLFREYKSLNSKIEGETDPKAKLDMQIKKIAILATFEQVQWTDESKAKFRSHFESDWPKYGDEMEKLWAYQSKYKLDQEKKTNPEKHTPLVPWEAKPDPGFVFVPSEDVPKPLGLAMNARVAYPAIPSAFALVETGSAAKPIRTVIDLGALKPVTVANLPEGMTPMQLSDDGTWVACQRADGTARKTIVEAGTGKTVLEAGSIADQTLFYSFLPNGRYLTLDKSGYGQDYQVVFTVHTLADKNKRTFTLPQLSPVALSPGGRYLACVWHNMRRITLVDLEDGKSKGDIQYADRTKVESGIRIAFSPDGKFLAAVYGGDYRPKVAAWSMETGAESTPKFEPVKPPTGYGSMTMMDGYLQWLPDNSGLLLAQRWMMDMKGQSLGELPALNSQKPFPRKVLGGNLYTDDRVGGLNRAGKLSLERLPIK